MTREWDACESGFRAIADWLDSMPLEAWQTASVLDGWTVSDLAAHLWLTAHSITSMPLAPTGTSAITIGEYISGYAAGEAEIDDLTRMSVGGPERTIAEVRQAMVDELAKARDLVSTLSPDQIVEGRRGRLPLADYLRTRAIEIAVHADDLARSVPEVTPPDLPRATERMAVRTLLDVLAHTAPGRSVEVRIPPYAAVQCIAGPRHSRGTPSNVIETDPTTWLRVATGRTSWSDANASGAISASGSRADLEAYLPLF